MKAAVFLKMDAATRHGVNYFANNLRYCDNAGKINTITLAVKDTEVKHESVSLQQLIEKFLNEFILQKKKTDY